MITLLQLDYFRRLAATEHITQTAKELYISQTALSSMIIGLEKELGVRLFDRSKRSIRLNQAGRVYLQYVNDVFTALENGRTALQELTETAEHQVSLTVGSPQAWLHMIRDFRKQCPEYSIKQYSQTLDGLTESLRTMKTDFVIAGIGEVTDPGFEHSIENRPSLPLCPPNPSLGSTAAGLAAGAGERTLHRSVRRRPVAHLLRPTV